MRVNNCVFQHISLLSGLRPLWSGTKTTCSSMQRLTLRSTPPKAITTCTLWRLKSKNFVGTGAEMSSVLHVYKPLTMFFDLGVEWPGIICSYRRITAANSMTPPNIASRPSTWKARALPSRRSSLKVGAHVILNVRSYVVLLQLSPKQRRDEHFRKSNALRCYRDRPTRWRSGMVTWVCFVKSYSSKMGVNLQRTKLT